MSKSKSNINDKSASQQDLTGVENTSKKNENPIDDEPVAEVPAEE